MASVLNEPRAAVHQRRLSPIDFLERSADVFREKIAVVDGDVRRTYPQFLDRVYRFAHVLHGFGIRSGERVAVLATRRILSAHRIPPASGTA
jgi:fatty-acyl-CoA synthase